MNNLELILRFILAVAGVWLIFVGLRDVGAQTAVLWREWQEKNDRALCVFAWLFVMILYGACTLVGCILIGVACYEPAHAAEPLTKKEIVKEVVGAGLSYIDYRQTLSIAHQPYVYSEKNPMIGNFASDAKIRNYFIGSTLVHIAVTAALPEKYRAIWQNSTLTWEAFIVGRNRYIGIRASL